MKFLFSFAMRNINAFSPIENFIAAEKHRCDNKIEFPGYDYAGNLKRLLGTEKLLDEGPVKGFKYP